MAQARDKTIYRKHKGDERPGVLFIITRQTVQKKGRLLMMRFLFATFMWLVLVMAFLPFVMEQPVYIIYSFVVCVPVYMKLLDWVQEV